MARKIKGVHARQILDSRGNPTVEVDVHLDDRHFALGRAIRRIDRRERGR